MKAEEVLRKICNYSDNDKMGLSDDITAEEALDAMEEYASIKQDELIEKIFGLEGVNYNYWFKKGRMLNFLNWLKSLPTKQLKKAG